MAGGALLFLHPALLTDAVGVIILVTIFLIQWIRKRKQPAAPVQA